MGWFHDALESTLETSVLLSVDEPKQPPGGGPFGRLVKHILFSRRFILTYHLVIFALISIFTVIHWSGHAIRWRRRRASRLRTLRLDDTYDDDAETMKPKL